MSLTSIPFGDFTVDTVDNGSISLTNLNYTFTGINAMLYIFFRTSPTTPTFRANFEELSFDNIDCADASEGQYEIDMPLSKDHWWGWSLAEWTNNARQSGNNNTGYRANTLNPYEYNDLTFTVVPGINDYTFKVILSCSAYDWEANNSYVYIESTGTSEADRTVHLYIDSDYIEGIDQGISGFNPNSFIITLFPFIQDYSLITETVYHPIDGRFLPIDGTTITLDANNQLQAASSAPSNMMTVNTQQEVNARKSFNITLGADSEFETTLDTGAYNSSRDEVKSEFGISHTDLSTNYVDSVSLALQSRGQAGNNKYVIDFGYFGEGTDGSMLMNGITSAKTGLELYNYSYDANTEIEIDQTITFDELYALVAYAKGQGWIQ